MINHNVFNKIAVINDMAGFGRCALSVQLPIISAMGVQCCPVPTAVLSNHSAFESFYIKDLTESMEKYLNEWKKIKLTFNAALIGYCGSFEQISMVEKFIDDFAGDGMIVVVDPIMGDNGKVYDVFDKVMCQRMKTLVKKADIITPNLTELCILADMEYNESYGYKEIKRMCDKVLELMNDKAGIVVTGLKSGSYVSNYVYKKKEQFIIRKKISGKNRCGTGDVFSAVLTSGIVKGKTLELAVKCAADFVAECIKESDKINMPKTDGVCFEKLIHKFK